MPAMPGRILVAPLLVSVLLLSACQPSADTAAPAQAKPKVGVVVLQAEPFELISELPGRTAAYRVAEVRPQVSGIIQKRLFAEGSEVKGGDQLYQIDPAVYEANLQSARAGVLSSRSLAERYATLVKQEAVSRQQYDEARAASLQADAALKQAEIDLRYTKVLAPISGRIGRSAASEGALVTSGQANELATIQQIDPIYVDVVRSAREMLNLRREMDAGQLQMAGDDAARVTLTLEDGSQYEHAGQLEFSEVSVDASTGSVTLRAVFPNPERLLLPGMFVRAQLVSGQKAEAILAPQQGVTRNPRGEPVAMVVNGQGQVEQRVLSAERTVGDRWLVSAGLQAGDQLITEGLQFIRAGDEVEVVPASNVKTASLPGVEPVEG